MAKQSKRAIHKRRTKLERASTGSANHTNKHNRRVKADTSKQATNNSYSPPEFYVDQKFKCIGCGAVEIWTALRQKQYYEEWKKPIYGRAVRCRPCRKRHKEERDKQRERSISGAILKARKIQQESAAHPPDSESRD
jgi:hypothetical protein